MTAKAAKNAKNKLMKTMFRGLCGLCVPYVVYLLAATTFAAGWNTSPPGAGQTGTDGWRPLFDGKTTAGWRGFRQKTMPAGWQAVDGALTRVGQAGDIVTVDEFGDFELTLEWNLSPNGNSGIHYRVTEDDEVMWHQAPEYQVIDNAYKDGLKPGQYAAANYDLHPPSRDVTKPIGSGP